MDVTKFFTTQTETQYAEYRYICELFTKLARRRKTTLIFLDRLGGLAVALLLEKLVEDVVVLLGAVGLDKAFTSIKKIR
jgi:hypothetical protein